MSRPAELHQNPILAVVARQRWGIALVLALVCAQQVAWLVEPTVFGHVIDALVGHHQKVRKLRELLVHLSLWLSIFAVNTAAGLGRRLVAEQVFTRLYANLAASLAELGKAQGERPSRIAARAEISRELITFLDTRVPELLGGSINVVGAVAALFAFDWRIGATCLGLTGPLALVGINVSRRMGALQRSIHNARESSIDVFASEDALQVRSHFDALGAAQRKLAFFSSMNFGVVRASLLAIFVIVLYIAIDLDDFSTGHLYAIVSYLWTFVAHAEDFPTLAESWSSLRDLIIRVRAPELQTTTSLPIP